MQAYKRFWRLLCCVGALMAATEVAAQDSTALRWYLKYHLPAAAPVKTPPIKVFPDSLLLRQALAKQIAAWQEEGYLEAYCDSIYQEGESYCAFVQLGRLFVWDTMDWGNLPPALLQTAFGKRKPNFQGKPFRWKEVEALQTSLLAAAENQGYPFAQMRLDSLRFEENRLSGRWNYQSGLLIAFDSIRIEGSLKIKAKFLRKYLKIQPGDLFEQGKIEEADKLLRRFRFVRLRQASQPVFKVPRAEVKVFADQQQANQIDGIVGLLPNELAPQQLLLTGQFDLKLRNLFQRAISFEAEFQRLRPSSELLHLEYRHPALLGANIEGQAALHFLREDTNFVNISRNLSFAYYLGSRKQIRVLFEQKDSQLGFAPAATSNSLPEVSEINYTAYGLAYEWQSLDDYYYPRKGWYTQGKLLIGNKDLVPNPVLDQRLYEGLAFRSLQLSLQGELAYYWPLQKRSILLLRGQGGYLFNENLFLNDLFRLGGLTSLRGHNQNFFFASAYSIATVEYRFLLEENSYLLLFYDQAFLERRLFNSSFTDSPLGLGAGISFSTAAGIFNFIYAVGQSQNEALNFSRAKIHFGFISRF